MATRRTAALRDLTIAPPLHLPLLALLFLIASQHVEPSSAGLLDRLRSFFMPTPSPTPSPPPPSPPPPAVPQNTIRAIYAFGDSLTDGGNSKWYSDGSVSCAAPYGRTALLNSCRWTDGKVTVDLIAERLGLAPLVPSDDAAAAASAAAAGRSINFALGGTGVTFQVEQSPGQMVDLASQITDFLNLKISPDVISRSLIFMTEGGNDFRDYYLNNKDSLAIALSNPINAFYKGILENDRAKITSVIAGVMVGIKRLYAAGARNFLLPTFPAIGCLPALITASGQLDDSRVCLIYLNRISAAYLSEFRTTLQNLNLPGATFLVPNLVDLSNDMSNNPGPYGLQTTKWSCCNGAKEFGACGKKVGGIPVYDICSDPSKYLFWDGIHPTNAAYNVWADRIWNGDSNAITPMNLKTFVQR